VVHFTLVQIQHCHVILAWQKPHAFSSNNSFLKFVKKATQLQMKEVPTKNSCRMHQTLSIATFHTLGLTSSNSFSKILYYFSNIASFSPLQTSRFYKGKTFTDSSKAFQRAFNNIKIWNHLQNTSTHTCRSWKGLDATRPNHGYNCICTNPFSYSYKIPLID